jgi:formylglycine-generating enzyme required for sulfatase activity
VYRGGSWRNGPRSAGVAYRGRGTPDLRSGLVGFRLVRSEP